MRNETSTYLKRLQSTYEFYKDNEGLMALASIKDEDERAAELAGFRELPQTQKLIQAASTRFETCLKKLTSSEVNKNMTDEERTMCFATMDWAKFTLDILGESPEQLDEMVDKMIMDRVKFIGNKLK